MGGLTAITPFISGMRETSSRASPAPVENPPAITSVHTLFNIAKPFSIAHLRSTVIGNSIYRIYKFLQLELALLIKLPV